MMESLCVAGIQTSQSGEKQTKQTGGDWRRRISAKHSMPAGGPSTIGQCPYPHSVSARSARAFASNPAAVCLLAACLDDDFLLAVAAENNLSETAYFIPGGDHGTSPLLRRNSCATSFTSRCWPSSA